MDSVKFYSELLKKKKKNPEEVGWKTKESQLLRFQVLCDIGEIRQKSILDFGCGTGDMWAYLKSAPIAKYVGYDNCPPMITEAKKKYKEGTFYKVMPKGRFDLILASGVFNYDMPDWRETMKMLWKKCRDGMAINFTSSLAEVKAKNINYFDPSEMLKFAQSLTGRFVLRHDYKPNDFTIYFYKQPWTTTKQS